jgi:TonB family protein
MIIIEFLVFVVSSGLFFNERFRHRLWAVIFAGAIATGSSLLFVYDVGAKLAGHENQPPVITKIVKQVEVRQVQSSQPASAGRPHVCTEQYPREALIHHQEGVTALSFNILTDGTVDAVKVMSSSGSRWLDEAAVRCVSQWHYRPAIRNGQLVETAWNASVNWQLPGHETAPPPQANAAEPPPANPAPKRDHAWYDVGSWFGDSDESDKKTP